MSATASPAAAVQVEIDDSVCTAVRAGLMCVPKWLPSWLFYDEAGSRLFEVITELPEYYLTRTERSILAAHAAEIISRACGDCARLRIAELGAGSADKTRLLLKATIKQQGTVAYQPVDVSPSALEVARKRIEQEIPNVQVIPRVEDYTRSDGPIGNEHGLVLDRAGEEERLLVLYIGSSIGNFEPHEALRLLKRVRAGLRPGDGLLLGVDLVKGSALLMAAYDDASGVTAAFNRNILARLNRELGSNFDLEAFAHRAVWNPTESRMEMHLESIQEQTVKLSALDIEVPFAQGERIHTENSYKYRPGQIEDLLHAAGFDAAGRWEDEQGWFGVILGRVF